MTDKQPNYYKPMTDRAFEDIKKNAIKVWETYDNEHGYVDDKVSRIKDLENVGDNGMYIIAMFDTMNIFTLVQELETDTLNQLNDGRMPRNTLPAGLLDLLRNS